MTEARCFYGFQVMIENVHSEMCVCQLALSTLGALRVGFRTTNQHAHTHTHTHTHAHTHTVCGVRPHAM